MVAVLERQAGGPHALAPVEQMNVEALFRLALESSGGVDTLERLMAMRRELVAEHARTAFFAALAGFQSECPIIQKTEVVKDRGGTAVRYRFAPLDKIVETIRPSLQMFELSYTFNASYDLENKHLIAVCEIHHALGHTERSEFRVPVASDSFMNVAQHFGSASSYARRYALCCALGIVTGDEDDDAQNATTPAKARQQERPNAAPAKIAPVNNAGPIDKQALMRDKRAQGNAAMGLVSRHGSQFRVTEPKRKDDETLRSYFVWRDADNIVRCECPEFATADDLGFRCEHILAVKHAVNGKLVKEGDAPPVESEAAEAHEDSPGVERRKLLERVVGLCQELGYDSAKQLKARGKAANHTDEVIRTKDIPSLERLVARHTEESRLRTIIYRELNTLYKSEKEIADFLAKNCGGKEPKAMSLEELQKVAADMELK